VTGATILAPAGPELGTSEAAFLRDADPWGFILFARNCLHADQIRRLVAALREAVGRQAPVFIDQEGGRVQRLSPPLARRWPPPLTHAAAAADPVRAMWLRYRLIAAELRALGIDGNCAPSCDIAGPATHPFLRDRCLGSDAAAVAARARAAAAGLLAGGVLPVIKHIPGHGRATADSHLALPVVPAPLDRLAATDFVPFAALADLPLAMTAHVVYPALDPDRPATLSPAVLAAIRGAMIGFGGLVMTDDMSMQALSGQAAAGDLGALTAAAIAAGCDLALHCNGRPDEMQAIAAAAGRLGPAAAARAAAALAARRAPEPADPAALAAELARLGGDG
jgi:beta-N-acetylhexosaminidase